MAANAPLCSHCNGRGSVVVAALSDTHYGADGRLAYSYAIPIVAPCVCAAERAARMAKRWPA